MNILLIAGLGPGYMNQEALVGSSFAQSPGAMAYNLSQLYVRDQKLHFPLLRRRGSGYPIRPTAEARVNLSSSSELDSHPNLTAFTLRSILNHAGIDHEFYQIERIWDGRDEDVVGDYQAVLLSTTFIWDRNTLARAIRWVEDRFPQALLILGGQYSNIKYREILQAHRSVRFIIRGDAEVALPRLLAELSGSTGKIDSVPNLVWADPDTGGLRETLIEYVDLEREPSPTFGDEVMPVIPYESMRGCPFSCKYCSFPAASPKWRYKSARKIASDFRHYRDHNGTQYVKALDSTFTVPPTRLRELLPMLAAVEVPWEAFTRANTISTEKIVEDLLRAYCSSLSLGLESMSEQTLKLMHKQVTAKANRRALELLRGGGIDYKTSFIVGYPGESPELFQETRDFLIHEYEGRFSLFVFMFKDETMPVWKDAERFKIMLEDPNDPDKGWSHAGMDLVTAQELQRSTLRDVRWANDRAIHRIWQHEYEIPLAPHASAELNLRIEKAVDRLGMASADFRNAREVAQRQRRLLAELREYGVVDRDTLPAGADRPPQQRVHLSPQGASTSAAVETVPVAEAVPAHREDPRQAVHAIIHAMARRDPGPMRDDLVLAGDLGYDSLRLIELAFVIEKHFSLPETRLEEVAGLATVGAVVELARRLAFEAR